MVDQMKTPVTPSKTAEIVENDATRSELVEKTIEGGALQIATGSHEQQSAITPTKSAEDSNKSARSQAEVLLEFAEDVELFHDSKQMTYADVQVKGCRATLQIKSDAFGRWMRERYYRATSKSLRSDAVKEAVRTLEARAQFEGACHPVFRRSARHNGKVYIDLGDPTCSAVEIDKRGWRVVDCPPVRFVRSITSRALPQPVRKDGFKPLRRILNIASEDDFILAVCWIVWALVSEGPFPILVVHGEQGSAKSTFSTILRNLVDPNEAPLRSLPRTEEDLFIGAQQNRMLAFDNLSGINASMSDALCRLATGGAFVTRKLFTNEDEVTLKACRPMLLNGIGDTITRSDLIDRSIIINLASIPSDRRRTVEDVMAEFEAAQPSIFSALLDAIVVGLQRSDDIVLPDFPRMADFAHFATACEIAFCEKGSVMAAYERNIAYAVEDVVDADVVAAALRDFMRDRQEWTGTANDLLKALETRGKQTPSRDRDWPKSAQTLSRHLNRMETALAKIGVQISRRRGKDANGTRLIQVTNESLPEQRGLDTERPTVASEAPEASDALKKSHNTNALDTDSSLTQNAASDAKPSEAESCVSPKSLEVNETDASDASDASDARPDTTTPIEEKGASRSMKPTNEPSTLNAQGVRSTQFERNGVTLK